FLSSKTAVFGLVIATLLILAAILAPWISPQNPYDLLQIDVLDARLAPGTMNGLNTFHYWLGTDGQGRDLLSGILYGLRISLMVG
ncbi:ABC transporter permease, partial [Yangia sp. PrR004]|nr:ABC transporter permease [Salipiger sp. PrR004]